MKKWSILSLILFIILLTTQTLAVYEHQGQNNYANKDGLFNTAINTVTVTGTKNIQIDDTPLVSDLDNDGINEIIVRTDDKLYIYQNKTLTQKSIQTLSNNYEERYSNIWVSDTDGDGYKEVFIAGMSDANTARLDVFRWNGTNLIKNATNTLFSDVNYIDSELLIGCQESNDSENPYCLIFVNKKITFAAAEPAYAFYNFTILENKSQKIQDYSRKGESGLSCMPRIKTITYLDYDNDNKKEWVFSMFEASSNIDLDGVIYYVNDKTVERNTINSELGAVSDVATATCETSISGDVTYPVLPQDLFTSPLMMDIDESPDTGIETIVGFSTNTALIPEPIFKMRSYKGTVNENYRTQQYPTVFNAQGFLLSNPFQADVFSGTGNDDFCVMGYDEENDYLDVLCASEDGNLQLTFLTVPVHSDEFRIEVPIGLVLNKTYNHKSTIVFSGQHWSADGYQNHNPDEIITSQGIYTIKKNSDLEKIYSYPTPTGYLLIDDAEGVGSADIIMGGDSFLYYINDGFVNSNGQITSYTINPCLSSQWKQNTSVEVSITVDDINDDLVSARSSLYTNHPNLQNNSFGFNQTAPTTFYFSFIANQTGNGFTLTMEGRDDENLDGIDRINRQFNVGSTGVVLNDCTTTIKIVLEGEETGVTATTLSPLETDEENNAITVAIDTLFKKLGIGRTLAWLIIMAIVMFGIWTSGMGNHLNGSMTLGIVAIMSIIMLIMGVLLGFIGYGILFAIIVLGLIVIGLWMGRMITGTSGG